ncbi:MAG TPA: ATP-binding protein [Geobacteraceae bacterium]
MTEARQRTILVVDDDSQILELLTSVLEKKGYCVAGAGSARDALTRLENSPDAIDVALSDVRLPEMSGIELLEQLHRIRPELPVILMTAFADLKVTEQAIKKHAFDFITKPITFDDLLASVAKAVEHVTLLELEKDYLVALEETVGKKSRQLLMEHEEREHLFRLVESIKNEWVRTMDCIGDMVILADADGKIRRCNRALRDFVSTDYHEILGSPWQPLLAGHGLHVPFPSLPGTHIWHETSDRWFNCTSYPFTDIPGSKVIGYVITIVDTTELKKTADDLALAYQDLKTTQAQMLQREKMASIGQLAAGVAHEINNPIGFITSNLGTLGKYVERLASFVNRQSELCAATTPEPVQAELDAARQELKIDHILQDIAPLIAESLDGAGRVRAIVQNMKSFSRSDEGDYKVADIIECVESAVNIAWNELKYKAELHKNYGKVPAVKCYPQQLNQVFMNLLVNAAHAIEKQGEITIDAREENGEILVSISDTGCGIAPEHLPRIFEPFFTTKDVGKGTGLGLSISYDIIKKHSGDITVRSEPGKGTTFTVRIPVT